jgi:hypothetical protein
MTASATVTPMATARQAVLPSHLAVSTEARARRKQISPAIRNENPTQKPIKAGVSGPDMGNRSAAASTKNSPIELNARPNPATSKG